MSETPELHHGFKRITAANWQEPDVRQMFPLMTHEVWLEVHLRPKLNTKIPEEVSALFEVARGAMIYGWFFYPLIALVDRFCER